MAGVKPWVCTKCGVLQIPPIAERTRDGLRATCTIVHGELAEMCGGVVLQTSSSQLGGFMPVEFD